MLILGRNTKGGSGLSARLRGPHWVLEREDLREDRGRWHCIAHHGYAWCVRVVCVQYLCLVCVFLLLFDGAWV